MPQAINKPNPKANMDPAIEELNRIVEQAEDLLRSLGAEGGEAAEAVRERVSQTLHQAKTKLAATASNAEEVVESLADRADGYVRSNPWQAVAIAALLGGVVTLLVTKAANKSVSRQ
jgi:ElaB/YqjD/DUF883 family membrane-anchored ribosome-binding protein